MLNGDRRIEPITGHTRLARGRWSHAVMARQGARMTVSLNGGPEPEIVADPPIGYPQKTDDIHLGGRTDNSANRQFANLQGMLEEVAVYNGGLTPCEVKTPCDAPGAKQLEQPTSP